MWSFGIQIESNSLGGDLGTRERPSKRGDAEHRHESWEDASPRELRISLMPLVRRDAYSMGKVIDFPTSPFRNFTIQGGPFTTQAPDRIGWALGCLG